MAKRKTTPSSLKKEANRFDKILKENLRRAIPAITSGVLNLRLVSVEMVTVELQRTRERKADFVAIVEDENGERFVLHIEFQVRNDGKMVYRMNDYNAVLMYKYPDLEIRQYVIFLGKQNRR